MTDNYYGSMFVLEEEREREQWEGLSYEIFLFFQMKRRNILSTIKLEIKEDE